MNIEEIPTPALLLDLDAFEANLERMASLVKQAGKALRPHAKAHKCLEIARRQMEAGAVGVCVATLAEAEMMAEGGITQMLLTSPVADPAKMARIVATGAMVVADHLDQVTWYNQAAEDAGRTLEMLVDMDVGDHRTGAATKDDVIAIAEAIEDASNLTFRGVQAYSVLGSHAGGRHEREEVSQRVFRTVAQTVGAMRRGGMRVDIVTGGSTGSAEFDLRVPELTELQAGSYVFMDMAYRKEGVEYPQALYVLGTVVSANHSGFVTVDAGTKAFSTDRGYPPAVVDLGASTFRWGGDEFGYVDLISAPRELKLGDRVWFLPPHCDPTVNLYDRIYACRGGEVEHVWPVKRASL